MRQLRSNPDITSFDFNSRRSTATAVLNDGRKLSVDFLNIAKKLNEVTTRMDDEDVPSTPPHNYSQERRRFEFASPLSVMDAAAAPPQNMITEQPEPLRPEFGTDDPTPNLPFIPKTKETMNFLDDPTTGE